MKTASHPVSNGDARSIGSHAGRRRPQQIADQLIRDACGYLSEGDPIGDLEAEHHAEVAADARGHRHR